MLNLLPSPSILISRLIVLIVAFTVHEFAHAWTADRFGDNTPRANGRLTLNPLVHLDPIGSLLILVAGFGWAKPVPVNLFALERENRYAPMWVALAGPVSNLIMAVTFAIPVRLGLVGLSLDSGGVFPTAAQLFTEFIYLNLVLMVFNLIPIFPLDGEKVLTYLLSPDSGVRRLLDQLRPIGPVLLMFMIVAGPLIGFDMLNLLVSQPVNTMFLALVGFG
jgi:Zn-dependent protease